ncbi:hypothetical protein V8C26DRAFT_397700 [Trichoderma gracile]
MDGGGFRFCMRFARDGGGIQDAASRGHSQAIEANFWDKLWPFATGHTGNAIKPWQTMTASMDRSINGCSVTASSTESRRPQTRACGLTPSPSTIGETRLQDVG